MLDTLHEDLNRVKEKPYTEMKDKDDRSDIIVAEEHWQMHLKRNQSMIVDLFQGQYKSTTTCSNCEHNSRKFEPFFSLLIEIPDNKHSLFVHCIIHPKDLTKHSMSITVKVSQKANVAQLITAIKDKINMDKLFVGTVKTRRFVKYVASHKSVASLLSPGISLGGGRYNINRDSIHLFECQYPLASSRKVKITNQKK